MKMANQILKKNILEIVDNQIKNHDPECTKQTLERLVNLGYQEKKAREMIGAVLIQEMYSILKDNRPFNLQKYAERLNELG